MRADRIRSRPISATLLGLLLALVCVRSWVPVTTYVHFDSDQAIYGIMARDLAALRAFPMFMYGQRYMLAVSVWLCAPLFALFGATIATLKLPLFLMNVAVVVMIWIGLRREPDLDPWGAALAILPFAMPAVVISTRLVEHAGGNIEPFVFMLAAFFLRERPIVLGVLLGVGFLNREFSLIGFFALLVMDLVQGTLIQKLKAHATTAITLAVVAGSLRALAMWSTDYGGSFALHRRPGWDNIVGFFGQQLPTLLGGAPRQLLDYNVISTLTVGHAVNSVAIAAWLFVVVVAFVRRPPARATLNGMSAYLVLVGVGQTAAYLLLSPYPTDKMAVRYVLISLLAVSGLVSLAWRRPALRVATAAAIVLTAAVNLTGNLRLLHEYATATPLRPLNQLAAALDARSVHYLRASYWMAFDIAWVTGERVIASPWAGSGKQITRYSHVLSAHRDETYTIEDNARAGCEPIVTWQLCPPAPHDNDAKKPSSTAAP